MSFIRVIPTMYRTKTSTRITPSTRLKAIDPRRAGTRPARRGGAYKGSRKTKQTPGHRGYLRDPFPRPRIHEGEVPDPDLPVGFPHRDRVRQRPLHHHTLDDRLAAENEFRRFRGHQIGRASCRERV